MTFPNSLKNEVPPRHPASREILEELRILIILLERLDAASDACTINGSQEE
jgi:hypothetical protein